jgi:hypothetical protein
LKLNFQKAAGGDRQLTLRCCQLRLLRQRQQCGLAAANWAAALWKAKGPTEPTFQNIERGVQCRVSGRHFEKIIVGVPAIDQQRTGGRVLPQCRLKTESIQVKSWFALVWG